MGQVAAFAGVTVRTLHHYDKAGLLSPEFRVLPADTRVRGAVTGSRDLMRAAAAFVAELGQGFADPVGKGTDLLLLSTTTAPLGWHISEATGTSSLGVTSSPPRRPATSRPS